MFRSASKARVPSTALRGILPASTKTHEDPRSTGRHREESRNSMAGKSPGVLTLYEPDAEESLPTQQSHVFSLGECAPRKLRALSGTNTCPGLLDTWISRSV